MVELDEEEKTLEYHNVDEIYENDYIQVFDVTNIIPVGHVEFDGDDEEMYEKVH